MEAIIQNSCTVNLEIDSSTVINIERAIIPDKIPVDKGDISESLCFIHRRHVCITIAMTERKKNNPIMPVSAKTNRY